ncbi:MAG: hypothetical protein LAQ30_05895 [Acidobacteriia bacterium]|nr:hypothetical protein [Terriglobia bacterium]
MATRSRTTFQKRQKELARIEKRRDKEARKAQRKQAAAEAERLGIALPDESEEPEAPPEDGAPTGSESE